jgi:hypothetical protein
LFVITVKVSLFLAGNESGCNVIQITELKISFGPQEEKLIPVMKIISSSGTVTNCGRNKEKYTNILKRNLISRNHLEGGGVFYEIILKRTLVSSL